MCCLSFRRRAPGPDGLPYELFSVPDVTLAAALLAFFELVRHWAMFPLFGTLPV